MHLTLYLAPSSLSVFIRPTTPIFAEVFHTDWSFLDIPPAGTCLYGIIIPPKGGNTLFADQVKAYENLPSYLKDKVDSLAFAIDIQKDSYNTIFNKIKSNETMYKHIPSIAPVKGYIGSKYGYRTDPIDGKRRMHSGLDFPVNLNTDVVATGDGVVTKAQYDSGWGRYIKIDHGYGYETVYAHLWKINVKKGQKVKRGDKIGKSGNSGRAAGFHLHYEVHKNNKTVDPLNYFFTGYID